METLNRIRSLFSAFCYENRFCLADRLMFDRQRSFYLFRFWLLFFYSICILKYQQANWILNVFSEIWNF